MARQLMRQARLLLPERHVWDSLLSSPRLSQGLEAHGSCYASRSLLASEQATALGQDCRKGKACNAKSSLHLVHFLQSAKFTYVGTFYVCEERGSPCCAISSSRIALGHMLVPREMLCIFNPTLGAGIYTLAML